MAKPTQLPEWATDETNNTEPSSGQKETGWEFNQPAVSSYFNWWQHLVFLWIAYLNDGELDGDHVIDGNLEVSNDLEVGGTLDVAGPILANGNVDVSGHVLHAARAHVQGFDGGLSSGTALSFHTSNATCTIAAGDTVLVPCRAPLIGGLSRIRTLSILFENNTAPSLSLYTKTGPSSFVEVGPSIGVSVSDVAVGGSHTRRTITITTPAAIGATDRVFFRIVNGSGTALVCHELIASYDAVG
jgi:hypothetical protein